MYMYVHVSTDWRQCTTDSSHSRQITTTHTSTQHIASACKELRVCVREKLTLCIASGSLSDNSFHLSQVPCPSSEEWEM